MLKYLLIIMSVLFFLGCAPDRSTPGEIAAIQKDTWEWSIEHMPADQWCGEVPEYPTVMIVTLEELRAKSDELNMVWFDDCKGIFEGGTRIIYILDDIVDSELTEEQEACFLESVLAHEMIHYLQASCGYEVSEDLAYGLQACYCETLCGLWLFDTNQDRVEGRCYD